MKFSDLGLNPDIVRALEEKGYTEPTPIQEQAIPVLLEGKDVIGSAQTGTGKTAAFALPTIQRLGQHSHTRCLVLGPTRELAAQVHEQFTAYGKYSGLTCALIHGGVNYGPQREALAAGVDVVAATPGRLLDHFGQKAIDLSKIEVLILDEVDRMLDMGFIEDVQKVIRACPKNRQTLLFSATIPDAVKHLAQTALKDPVEVSIGINLSPAETVDHSIWPVDPMQKFTLLVRMLEDMGYDSLLIFCRTRVGADIARWLKEHDHSVKAMHSDLSQKDRTRVLQEFKDGKIEVLVATDIASRGLDIKGISHVINYDVPQHAEDYVHRIGRTGRAREQGFAYTLVASDEIAELDRIERFIGSKIERRKLEGFNYRYTPLLEEKPVQRKRRNRGFSRR
jgi:ATP-dependent RNA helicase RhlE